MEVYRRFAPRLLVAIAPLGLTLGGWFWWRLIVTVPVDGVGPDNIKIIIEA